LIQATLPSSDLAQGATLNVAVNNPAPGGGTSSALPFTVAGMNFQPVVGTLSPASATAGGPSFTLTLSSSYFAPGSVVSFNGSSMATAFSTASELQASIPASAIAVAGTPVVTVSNPGGNPSTVVTFTINNPVPQENSLSPTIAIPAGAGLTMSVSGSNYNASSVVLINGAALPTTFVNSTLLQTMIPAIDMAQSAVLNVAVKNPGPGGGITAASSFTVADYSLTAQAASATVNAGGTTTFNLLLEPPSSGVPYPSPISFAASGLPAGATASFAPSTPITLASASSTVTLTIVTASQTAGFANRFPDSNRQPMQWLCFVGMALALVGLAINFSVRRVPRVVPQFLWTLLLIAVAGLGACGSSVTGTSTPEQSNPDPVNPGTNYTITVTATSPAASHSIPLTLTVM
jgi:hypothetical protein